MLNASNLKPNYAYFNEYFYTNMHCYNNKLAFERAFHVNYIRCMTFHAIHCFSFVNKPHYVI